MAMAMSKPFVPPIHSALYSPCTNCHPRASRPRRSATTSASSAHRRRALIGLAMNSSGINSALPIRGDTKLPAVGPGPAKSPGGNLPIPNIPSWAKWVVGAIIVAVPIYRRIRTLEDKVEKTAEAAIEVVETVAEATEKVASEVAIAFPGNENAKEAASKIKDITDTIEKDAEIAEALIHKVDEIKKEVDSIVEPIIDKGEAIEKAIQEEEADKNTNQKPQ